MQELKPVAKIANMYGDPESFAERELKPLVDIQKIPCGTDLYALPATHRIVPVELLTRCAVSLDESMFREENVYGAKLRAIIDKEPT